MTIRTAKRFVATIVLCGCALLGVNAAAAQEAAASADTTTATASMSYSAPSSLRLGLQGRYNLFNTIYRSEPMSGLDLIPIITPGVRLINERLYLGLGFGFWGWDSDNGDNSVSRAAFSMSPTVFYDLISESLAALAIGGWLTIADISDTKECVGDNCNKNGDGGFGFGLNLGAQIRGKISRALAIGGEFGWGFLLHSGDTDVFLHGVFGNILLEASVGL